MKKQLAVREKEEAERRQREVDEKERAVRTQAEKARRQLQAVWAKQIEEELMKKNASNKTSDAKLDQMREILQGNALPVHDSVEIEADDAAADLFHFPKRRGK